MKPAEAAWVRAHAWPPRSRRRGADPVPGSCSCNDGSCFPCTKGWHHECFTAKHGPDADVFLAPVSSWSGEQVSQVVCGPGERLCVFVCPCGCRDEQPVVAVTVAPKPRRPLTRRASTAVAVVEGQLGLFQEVAR
jgi:hypothetical protein